LILRFFFESSFLEQANNARQALIASISPLTPMMFNTRLKQSHLLMINTLNEPGHTNLSKTNTRCSFEKNFLLAWHEVLIFGTFHAASPISRFTSGATGHNNLFEYN
jgi:hypothetical protein